MAPSVPAGYTLRRPTSEDIPAIIALLADFDTHFIGTADAYTTEDIEGDWHRLNVATDAWVVSAPSGALAAYTTVTDNGYGQLNADGYVHPDHFGRGLGTLVALLTEERARELVANAPDGARVVLGNGVLLNDHAAREILERNGFTLARVFWRMGIEMEEPPPAPEWPAGITVRTFVTGQDERAVFEAVEESFADHWGHVPRSYEQWSERFSRSDFDPSLWLLVVDGDQIAGVALNARRPDGGWVGTLAVRRPWRGKGLGTALLHQTFGEFYRRGERSVGLGVDAQSLTGARQIYERAGMRPVTQAAYYHKELRPGDDLSVRELAS